LKALHPTSIFNQFTKIRNKIFSLTFLLLFLFGIMGILIFQLLTIIYEGKIYEESAENLNLSSHVLDEELEKIETLSFQISTEDFTQNNLEYLKDESYNFQVYLTQAKLIERMTMIANQDSYINSISLIDANGQSIEVGRGIENRENIDDHLEKVDSAEGGNVWITSNNNEFLLASRAIKQKKGLSLDHLGYIIITIHMDSFIESALNYLSNYNFIITIDDQIIHKGNFLDNQINSLLSMESIKEYDISEVGGEEYFVTKEESDFSNITYYNMRPFEDVVSTKKLISRLMVGYFILMLVLTIFLSRKSAQAISKPIEQLTKMMKQVQNGNFDPVYHTEEPYLKDEIGDLQHNFYIMLDKINELIKENYTKQLLIKETEYKALQSQINPHFLYNTLDSINWLARVNDQKKISNMVEALGNMLRNIISKKAPLITIKEELEIIEHYITIQKYRYGDRLSFKLDYDESLEMSRIPKLTIQPLVENSIQHGLEEMTTKCNILVQVTQKKGLLQILILDNGPGMDEETIKHIYNGNIKPKGSGIGLYNINERIRLMFREGCHVKVLSKKGLGTKIKIVLPFMKG
jgi:two-component system sensor histidine kinase YesM